MCSDDLVLLEVVRTATAQVAPEARNTESEAHVHAVDPADVEPYEPAGHAKTRTAVCSSMSTWRSSKATSNAAAAPTGTLHRDNEQLLYVLGGLGAPLLIYYPKGAPHGTGGGIAEPLELLVVYSPPLGESQNALV